MKNISRWFSHLFHVTSNVRPLVWISGYVVLIPVFAFVYWLLPAGEFRVPDGAGTDFGSWLYYSIVTITTLGFGDYTPAHGLAQFVTAIEVMSGLLLLGFFLNAVGAMKSEIDLDAERERQRLMHTTREHDKLVKSIPLVLHRINAFMAYCYAVTTPKAKRSAQTEFNPSFAINDMSDMYQPSGFEDDRSGMSAASVLMHQAGMVSLCLDSLQTRIDLTLWPNLLEDCFTFVANCQLFDSTANLSHTIPAEEIASATRVPDEATAGDLRPVVELYHFIKDNAAIAQHIETALTEIANTDPLTEVEQSEEQ